MSRSKSSGIRRTVGHTEIARATNGDRNQGGLATLDVGDDQELFDRVSTLMTEIKQGQAEIAKKTAILDRLAGLVAGEVPVALPKHRGRQKGSNNKVKAEAGGDEAPAPAKAGSNSAFVLQLVQKYAPNKKSAKTKRQLRESALADKEFSGMTDIQLNTGLQANRPPKVNIPRINQIPGPDGQARGGKYYALV